MRFRSALFIMLILLSSTVSSQNLVNALLPYWNQSVGDYTQQVESNIIYLGTGDINKDGYGEVVVAIGGSIATSDATKSNRVYCFSENGTLLWSRGFENQIESVTMADVERDGKMEIFVGTGQSIQLITRGTIEVLESDGNIRNVIHLKGIIRSITVSDLDSDRYPEVIGVSRNIIYVSDVMGKSIWEHALSGSPPPDPSIVVVDFIGDSRKEVVVGGYDIRLLNQSGSIDYSTLSIESVTGKKGDLVSQLAVGPILPTGKQILFSTERSDLLYLYSLEKPPGETERQYIQKWTYSPNSGITLITLYDIDGDGQDEILYADENEMLYALEGNGKIKWSFKTYGKITDIQFSDLNNDNQLEVAVASTSGLIQVLDAVDGSLVWDYTIPAPISSISINNLNLDSLKEVAVATMQRNIHIFSVNESYTELFEANAYYQLGQRYFLDSKYNESLKYLSKARAIYVKYESRGDILRVDELVATINDVVSKNRRDMADIYYDKAVQFFIDEDYAQAKSFAKDAKSLYEDFGDTRNALKAELLLIKIDDKISNAGETTTSVPQNKTVVVESKSGASPYPLIFVLVLIITIILLNVAYKRKKASSKQESKEVQEYEKRLEKVLDQDIQDLGKK